MNPYIRAKTSANLAIRKLSILCCKSNFSCYNAAIMKVVTFFANNDNNNNNDDNTPIVGRSFAG